MSGGGWVGVQLSFDHVISVCVEVNSNVIHLINYDNELLHSCSRTALRCADHPTIFSAHSATPQRTHLGSTTALRARVLTLTLRSPLRTRPAGAKEVSSELAAPAAGADAERALHAETTRTAASAWATPDSKFLMKSRWPGASMSVIAS